MYSEDNKAKKRMLKNWAVQFMDDKTNPKTSTSSTVLDSKAFDNLLDITEEIETQSEILVSDLDKATIETGQARFDTKSNEVVSRLYRDVRKGLSALTKTNFKDLPRSDVGKLESYSNSLGGYYDRLNAINEQLIDANQPSLIDFVQEEQTKNTEIENRSDLIEQLKEKIKRNQEEKRGWKAKEEKDLQRVNDELSKPKNLTKELEKINKEKQTLEEEYTKWENEYTNDDDVEYDEDIEKRIAKIPAEIQVLDEDYQDMLKELQDYVKPTEKEIKKNIAKIKKDTKDNIAKNDEAISDLQKEINTSKDLNIGTTKKIKALEPLALKEKTKKIKKASSAIDFKLILQNYKVFLDTLTDGLRLYNSGLSGKVNKIGETVGSGRMVGGSYIIGGAEYQHRRFM